MKVNISYAYKDSKNWNFETLDDVFDLENTNDRNELGEYIVEILADNIKNATFRIGLTEVEEDEVPQVVIRKRSTKEEQPKASTTRRRGRGK